MTEAGFELRGNQLINTKSNQPVVVEYLLDGPLFERIALAYQTALKKIGIDLRIRTVDSSQYEERERKRDFDIIYGGWGQSLSPGNEQIDFFGSKSADKDASRNYGAVRDSAVDAITALLVKAPDRETLIAATKALDRVLLWNRYVVPGWTLRKERIARWDRFSHPEPLPQYGIDFPTIWWWDEAKAAKVGAAQ
jgi:microcin C transport system substrate-binding protein